MKVKAAPKKGKVLVELASQDEGLPPSLPFQLKRILAPVDFSEASRKALQYAAHFAAAFNAEVILLHVIQPFTLPVEPEFMPPELGISRQELVDSSRRELEEWCAREIGGRVQCQVRAQEGVPWHQIVAAASDTNTDLIILATHGRSGLKHVLLGSVVERVTHHAPCPVLVVREQERDFVPTSPKG